MTAEEDENLHEQSPTNDSAGHTNNQLPTEIIKIFEHLSRNDTIIFKSQQIDDPELDITEKLEIACDIYTRNRETFLMRFGIFLEEYHLSDFARLAIVDGAPLKPDEHYEEMQFMLIDFKNRLQTRRKDVKNRRYAAMQQLIKQNEYFSEQEMMKRQPALYQELIGQYLSEAEKKQRDGYDVRNSTFSDILMHTHEQQEMKHRLRLENNADDDIISETVPLTHTEEYDTDVPDGFRQQWGNFENEQIACSTSRVKYNSVVEETSAAADDIKLITSGERDLLREEFIGIMHADFLAGNDKDFDYTQVDENTQLDDLRQLNQDKEDAYFEESDDDNENAVHLIQQKTERIVDSEESEDELDIYMNHLSKHHSLQ